LREHLPCEAEEIVREADEICRHRFRLLGYRDLDYGAQIDWHLDAVNGRRSPLIPWFKIDFLDFAQVGDHKVVWELSRHQHLVTLAKAWLLTNEEIYVREIFAQWYSWNSANPYPLGANWASSLEVAFRSLSWIWLGEMLWECPAVPASFQQDLLLHIFLPTHISWERQSRFFLSEPCVLRFLPPNDGSGWAGESFKKKPVAKSGPTAYISSNRCITTYTLSISSCTRVCLLRAMEWKSPRNSILS
jgi:hypothetical protein